MDRGTGGTAMLIARPMRELDDHALVAEVRRGSDEAFEALYDRYLRRITAYVKGMVYDHGRAEDVSQEIFMSALRRMRETERPIAFKPWIYEIARNACIDQHRRSKRTEEVSFDADQGPGSSDHLHLVAAEPTPDAAVDTKQQLDHLCGAFGGLTPSHHEILVLRELEGMSYREIGDRMILSRPAVESTLFRARRRLTEEYQDLASGRRCERVQAIIGAAAEGMLGARDHRRLSRHVSYCQGCRHHARRLGVQGAKPARGVRARVAALLPIPAFLRGGRAGPENIAGSWSSQASSTLAQWAGGAGAAVEPMTAGWAKSAATLVTMAALGVGAGVSSHSGAITGLTHGAPGHAALEGAPRPLHPVEPRTSLSRGPSPGVGPALGAAGASVTSVPVSASPRPGLRGAQVARPGDRGVPGGVRAAIPSVTGGQSIEVPGVPVQVHGEARLLASNAQEHPPSAPTGVSIHVSTPIGETHAELPLPNATLLGPPPAEVAPVGTAVAGARSVAGSLIAG